MEFDGTSIQQPHCKDQRSDADLSVPGNHFWDQRMTRQAARRETNASEESLAAGSSDRVLIEAELAEFGSKARLSAEELQFPAQVILAHPDFAFLNRNQK